MHVHTCSNSCIPPSLYVCTSVYSSKYGYVVFPHNILYRIIYYTHNTHNTHNTHPLSLLIAIITVEQDATICRGCAAGRRPLLFCLCIHNTELSFFYLDDGTLGGSVEDLSHDLEVVKRVGSSVGLVQERRISWFPALRLLTPSRPPYRAPR